MQTANIPSEFTGPGLVDAQINGYAGVNFNEAPEKLSAGDFRKAMSAMKRRGVVAAIPTLVTDDFDVLLRRCEVFRGIVEADAELAAFYPKLHIEGPFISSEQGPRGAHRERFTMDPAERPGAVDELVKASGGRIGIITFAPERRGAEQLVKDGAAAGVVMSLGHCSPTVEQINTAVAAGATMCTHLGNGSHQMLPRLDNYLQKQLSCDELSAGLIADGHHIPFFTLKNFIRIKGVERCFLVTDAINAAEMGPGIFSLSAEDEVEVTPEGRCQIAGQANLAGSVLTLDRAVINVVKYCGVSWADAWKMASTNPVKILKLDNLPEVTVKITPDDRLEIVNS